MQFVFESDCGLYSRYKKKHNDIWYHVVTRYIYDKKPIPLYFIGHCCEIKENVMLQSEEYGFCNTLQRKFDGYMHIPCAGLLLDSPSSMQIDMHAIGGSDRDLTALKHAVVNEYTSIECYNKNIILEL